MTEGRAVGGLYFVTADVPDLGRTHEGLAALAAAGGARFVQYRHKVRDSRRIEAADAVRAVCRAFGVRFIINDDADLANVLGADGLHLGQSDLRALARWHRPPGGLLGISASNVAEAREAARLGAGYVGVGPIFATGSKDDAAAPMGLEGLRAVRSAVELPIAAIGGITEENAAEVVAAGADAICVISAIARAGDPHAAAARLAAIIETYRIGSDVG
jgi:thiamine-phosphate pyrophosphorylase